jgi:TonB family protein
MKHTLKKLLFFFSLSVFLFPYASAQDVERKNDSFDCAVRIKVEMLDSGKIGKTSMVSSSCNDEKLEEAALEAAKQIKFEPKKKDGKPITVTRTAEYRFTVQNKEKAETNDSAEKDRPLKILEKPEAAYPKSDTGTVCIQGTVTLIVQFLSDGKIGKIRVVSGLPYGATENAVEAAKKIKFEPAVKDGKPVSIIKAITYNFTIY